MNRKQLISRLFFGLGFITVSAIGASFIARGVNGILDQKSNDKVMNNNPLPFSPTGQGNNSNYPQISTQGNVIVQMNAQPLTWGRVSHFNDRPDEYHAYIQYRNLVKVIGISTSNEQGVIMDFSNSNDDAMVFDTETLISFMEHIYVKGYVYFAGAKSDTTGTNGGAPMYFPFGDKYSLYQLLSNNQYIDITATNSLGYYVPPTSISLTFTFSTSEWYVNGTRYAFNFERNLQPTITQKYNLNVIGYNK